MKQITIYDTTLRDGSQSEDIQFSTADKIKIALKLDNFGIPFIEGGWPGSNAIDVAFFKDISNYNLKHAKITAFGSTHHPAFLAENDPNLKAILESKVSIATIFGKTWSEHATEALKISTGENLKIIQNSILFLISKGLEVFFDAEHYFDGFKVNPKYALTVIKTAYESGAKNIILCDTNGGTLPRKISDYINAAKETLPNAILGIHAHNDCELAVANSLAAVESGVSQIQGTFNGLGERCGNANLTSLIPILELKTKNSYSCINKDKIKELTSLATYISEIANIPIPLRQPFVGRTAFTHKGGIHASAVTHKSSLYEHVEPVKIGNKQKIIFSEMAGRSNIIALGRNFGLKLDKNEPIVKGLFNELKEKTAKGYDYAVAEASVELLLLRKLGQRGAREFFKLEQLRILETKLSEHEPPISEATISLNVEGITEHTAAYGYGPVNALDIALRKALVPFYPKLNEMKLLDFKVRVIDLKYKKNGTAAAVRVFIESGDHKSRWVTVGVSYNIIEASWQALADSITYKLYKDEYQSRLEPKNH